MGNSAFHTHSVAYYQLILSKLGTGQLVVLAALRVVAIPLTPICVLFSMATNRRPCRYNMLRDWLLHSKFAILYGSLPEENYYYGFYEDGFPPYLYTRRIETKGLYSLLNGHGRQDTSTLSDKAKFLARCSEFHLPTPETHHVLRKGERPARVPKDSLFIKPTRGSGGVNTHAFDYDPFTRRYRNLRTSAFTDEEGMKEFLGDQALFQDTLVQRRLRNAASLEPLSPLGLATIRVYTIQTVEGNIDATNALMRMAGGNGNITDNISYLTGNDGNLAAAFDLQTARLKPAFRYCHYGNRYIKDIDTHPVTQARITGTHIPELWTIRDLCLRAHRLAFPSFMAIGWDVALTDDGPVLIEGNWNASLGLIQIAEGCPLGSLRLGRMLNDCFQSMDQPERPLRYVI